MNYKNHNPGTVVLLALILSFTFQQVGANNLDKDISHSLFTLPIIDNYGIAGELSIDEINRYDTSSASNTITPMLWYEATIRIPHWIKETRYCNYCSEIPLFETLKTYGSRLTMKMKPLSSSSEDEVKLTVSSDYSYKEFTTSISSLPGIPKEQSAIIDQVMTILLATNPIMLREFDTDSYLRWAWVDNTMGSWFEKQPIKTMPHTNPRVLKLNPGDHYRMALIMDENNQPEAIILDDAQGASYRKLYNYLTPVYYGANAFELIHHAKQAMVFGKGTFLQRSLSHAKRLANSVFLGHNLFEFAEHTGHLQVVQKSVQLARNHMSENKEAVDENTEDEFEPDYILGIMDLGNLVSTTGELIYQLPLGPLTLIENSFSLGIGIANLLVSANQKTLIEGYDDRIDQLISRYFEKDQLKLFRNHQKKL